MEYVFIIIVIINYSCNAIRIEIVYVDTQENLLP